MGWLGGWDVALVGSSRCSCGGGGVVGPVASGGLDPVACGGDLDAEGVGEDGGGELGGELDECGSAGGSCVDAECAEAGAEPASGDGAAGEVAGEQPW